MLKTIFNVLNNDKHIDFLESFDFTKISRRKYRILSNGLDSVKLTDRIILKIGHVGWHFRIENINSLP